MQSMFFILNTLVSLSPYNKRQNELKSLHNRKQSSNARLSLIELYVLKDFNKLQILESLTK